MAGNSPNLIWKCFYSLRALPGSTGTIPNTVTPPWYREDLSLAKGSQTRGSWSPDPQCRHKMRDIFLIVRNSQVDLNSLGTITWSFWIQIEQHRPLGKCHIGKSHDPDHCSPLRPSSLFLYCPHKALWPFFFFQKLHFSSTSYCLVMRELLRSLGSDHNQPWELDTKAQPVRSFAFQAKLCSDNLAIYCHKQMVKKTSSNRMIVPNSISSLWAFPTNESIITSSWDHYTALFPSALFAQ